MTKLFFFRSASKFSDFMEQRLDYIEKQISRLGLMLNKIQSNSKFLDEESGAERFFSLIKEEIGLDLRNVVVSKEHLLSLTDSGLTDRDSIFDLIDIMLLMQDGIDPSDAELRNILVMLDYAQSTSGEYSFDLYLKTKKIEEKLTDKSIER